MHVFNQFMSKFFLIFINKRTTILERNYIKVRNVLVCGGNGGLFPPDGILVGLRVLFCCNILNRRLGGLLLLPFRIPHPMKMVMMSSKERRSLYLLVHI